MRLPLGGVFLVLAVIGLISVAGFCIRLTNQIMDNTREKSNLKSICFRWSCLTPVEFDSPEHADPLFLLQSSLWGTLLSNTDKYTYDENAMLVVPASDLDVYAAKLYGSDIKLQHQTIEDFDFTYPYDPETKNVWRPGYGTDQPVYPAGDKDREKGRSIYVDGGIYPPRHLVGSRCGRLHV